MTDQMKLNVFAVCVLAIALAFAGAELLIFVQRGRVLSRRAAVREGIVYQSQAKPPAALLILSLLCFPATMLSLVSSFAAPWQLLWPSAALFLVSGVAGLVGSAWLATERRRVVGLIAAAVAAVCLCFLALSGFLFKYR